MNIFRVGAFKHMPTRFLQARQLIVLEDQSGRRWLLDVPD